jgi:hypothetical protein
MNALALAVLFTLSIGQRKPPQPLDNLKQLGERIVRAVLEGVAYNSRWLLETVEKFTGRSFASLNFIGGGGTGGTTAYILDRLPEGRAEYVFTDIGPLFIARAKKTFARYPFVRFQTYCARLGLPSRRRMEGRSLVELVDLVGEPGEQHLLDADERLVFLRLGEDSHALHRRFRCWRYRRPP